MTTTFINDCYGHSPARNVLMLLPESKLRVDTKTLRQSTSGFLGMCSIELAAESGGTCESDPHHDHADDPEEDDVVSCLQQ